MFQRIPAARARCQLRNGTSLGAYRISFATLSAGRARRADRREPMAWSLPTKLMSPSCSTRLGTVTNALWPRLSRNRARSEERRVGKEGRQWRESAGDGDEDK